MQTLLTPLSATPFPIPAILKVRLGSIVALTVTDSIIPIATVELSRFTELTSWVCIPTFQISAVPAVDGLVGLIRVGTCVVHDPPLWAEHPIKIVTVVPAAMMPLVVQVMLGEVTATPDGLLHAVAGFETTFAAAKLLNAKVEAEGEAELSAAPG